VRVTIATSLADVLKLRPLWMRLLENSCATIFQRFDWNLLALETFADEKSYFVAVESDSFAAIVPAVVSNREIRLAGGPLFDYRDAVCVGSDAAFIRALERVDDLGLPWNVVGIPFSTRWPAAQSWTAAPLVSLRDVSAQAFAERHSRARRSLRRLRDLGASVRVASATYDVIERIYREKAKEPSGWGENVFQDRRCIEFMRKVVALPETHCDIFLMEVKDDPVAALVTFVDGNVRRFYTTWMDERWSRHSPGIALLYEATCRTLAAGLDCDYMTGEQPYKLRFATRSAPLYKLVGTATRLSSGQREIELPTAA
jgi:CelD/BcsL family acetyltransferase involved in cellulose biosynthesis